MAHEFDPGAAAAYDGIFGLPHTVDEAKVVVVDREFMPVLRLALTQCAAQPLVIEVADPLAPAAVQGAQAPGELMQALQALYTRAAAGEIDVILLVRGGGSLEDLLPFSDEGLIRTVAAMLTPVISAIGHEADAPLLDMVADLRASTPTDAAKRVVPDVKEEWERITQQRDRARRVVGRRLSADASEITRARATARRSVQRRIDHGVVDLEHLRARLTALSPASTLERGYAVLRTPDGAVVRDPAALTLGESLDVRVAHGAFTASVEDLP